MHPLNAAMTKAAQDGDLPEMKNLYGKGAELQFTDTNNPLLQAACKGHVDCMGWLLDMGVDVDRHDNGGKWSPLMCAAHYGHPDAVRLLLERGADRKITNTSGRTALDCARQQGKADVVNVLLNNADEVSFSYPLSDRVLQEVFNFKRLERVTLVRNGEGGPVEAVQRDSFASLDDMTGLRKAFAEHKRMGGKLEENDVFAHTLHKTKILRKEL